MAIEKVEFEFPEPETEFKIEVEGNKSEFMDKKQDDDVEIEVVDDTPPKDRGREV